VRRIADIWVSDRGKVSIDAFCECLCKDTDEWQHNEQAKKHHRQRDHQPADPRWIGACVDLAQGSLFVCAGASGGGP